MIKITTINVRGLSSLKKKKYLSEFLIDNKIDIACLQEISNSFEDFPDGNYIYVLNRGLTGLGTAIVYRKELKPIETHKDINGRIIKLTFKDYSIINVYGYPLKSEENNLRKRINFFTKDIPKYINSNENIILLGDFNAVPEKKQPGTFLWNLKNLIENLNYIDCHEIYNKSDIIYTYISQTGKSRIDRIYINNNLKELVKECGYNDYIQSDHRAVSIQIETEKIKIDKFPSPFWRMNISVLTDTDYEYNFKNTLREAIKEKKDSEDVLNWWSNTFKPKIKYMTIDFCKSQNKLEKSNKIFINNCLNQLAKEIADGKDSILEYNNLKKQECDNFEQKKQAISVTAKLTGQIEGEQVSVAHVINQNRRKNAKNRKELKSSDGTLKCEERDKEKIIYDYYVKLYTLEKKNQDPSIYNQNINKIVNDTEAKHLTERLNLTEIKNAILDLKDGKSPGMDGLPVEFYKIFWEDLKDILLELYIFILDFNIMSKDQKTGAISLIHKSKDKNELDNWRPISLLCVDYKILAKILTNRIKPVLNKIISPQQTGGLSNRNVSENLCNTRNTLLIASENNGAILSLDFAKAFDQVDRQLVYKTMSFFRFPPLFIKWIQTLYEDSKIRVILNGKLGNEINMGRGIKQGCPLAMYLYIIYIEPLVINLQNNLKGIKIGSSRLKINAYVDDIVIFTSEPDDFILIDKTLDTFEN